MADRVRYYSTYDLSIPFELERADKVIARYQEGWRPEGVNDVIELFNIWQFVANGIVSAPQRILQASDSSDIGIADD